MSNLANIKTEIFHKWEIVCRLETRYYNCVFLFRDISIPVQKRVDSFGLCIKIILGYLIKDDIKKFGILIVISESEVTETPFTFTETPFTSYDEKEKSNLKVQVLNESNREKVIAFANYPFLPLNHVEEKLQIPEITNNNNEYIDNLDISNIYCSKNSEPFVYTLLQMANDENFTDKHISLFKEYKYEKMKELMGLNEKFYSKILSSCIFLSIEILKEFPSYKWSWVDVTKNSAIPIRDIMNNRDIPWDIESIIERDDISLEILESMNIDIVEYGYNIEIIQPKKRNFSQFECLISPQEPKIIKYGSEIKDEIINSAIDEILHKYPEYKNNKLEELRVEVITFIKIHGEFNIDYFNLPNEEDDDYIYNDEFPNSEITEDDPLGIAGLISAMKTNKNGFRKILLEDNYRKKTGYSSIYINYDELIQNRSDYVKLLQSRKSCMYDNLEGYYFFKLTDPLEYPSAFGISYSGIVNTSSIKRFFLR